MISNKGFFSTPEVLRDCNKKTRRVFSRFGAFVRRTAKQSIRKRKASAPPGQPPSSHKGLLKKFIFFVYDAAKRSVIIGPQKLQGLVGDAPHALEEGDKSTVTVSRRVGRSRARIQKSVSIEARPYMGPAAAKESQKLPSMWADSVK